MQADEAEASHVVFLGWPGQHDMEADDEAAAAAEAYAAADASDYYSNLPLGSNCVPAVQPPVMLTDDRCCRPGNRQLGCDLQCTNWLTGG